MEPVIKVPRRITREFIQSNEHLHFLYSYSFQPAAHHGQSSVCIGLCNTSPIPVRYSLCSSSGYFSDNIKTIPALIIMPFMLKALVEANFKPIIPFPRMGCGRSRMKEFAPNHWAWMMSEIDRIKYPNIEYV